MPKKIELRVEASNHYGKGLRKGDQVTLPRGITGLIESMEAKQTYLHVTLVGGTKGRLPLGSEINVTREVPTDDEQNLFDMVRIQRHVEQNWESYKKAMERGLEKLASNYQSYMAKGYLNPIDLELAAQIKLDEMRWRIYETIRVYATDLLTDAATPEHGATTRAVMRVRVEFESDLTRRSSRALSRSTSVISNLEEDMAREVKVEFLDESKFWGVEDLWERIGTVL